MSEGTDRLVTAMKNHADNVAAAQANNEAKEKSDATVRQSDAEVTAALEQVKTEQDQLTNNAGKLPADAVNVANVVV